MADYLTAMANQNIYRAMISRRNGNRFIMNAFNVVVNYYGCDRKMPAKRDATEEFLKKNIFTKTRTRSCATSTL